MKTPLNALLCLVLICSAFARGGDEAPKEGMLPGYWSSGVKQFFGTAFEAYDSTLNYSERSPTAPLSKVWFTGAQGILTEVYWPQADISQVRDQQLLVTDGSTFFAEERGFLASEVQWIQEGVPSFRIITRDPKHRFEIQKQIFADPDRHSVVIRYEIKRFQRGLRFYLHHNPSVGNSPLGDTAMASRGAFRIPAGLYASQDNFAQAVVATLPFKQVSAGFEGSTNDGFQDLRDFQMDHSYTWARNGNVVLTAWLDIPEEKGNISFDVAIGFASTPEVAHAVAWDSLNQGLSGLHQKYARQWRDYLASVKNLGGVSGDNGSLFIRSVSTLKAMEDKSHAGAFVAAPSVPWGLNQQDWNEQSFSKFPRNKLQSGYHIVWPRDLYQMASAFLSIDDSKTAIASLNYLKRIQYQPGSGEWVFGPHRRAREGSFPQNCWIDGENHWGGLQLDEVGMPIVLAYRLWKAGAISANDQWAFVRMAADFLADFGPWSPQERWEEIFGLSPSTIAAEIAGLTAAAEFARHAEDFARAKRYQELVTYWNQQLETWLFTTTGAQGNGKYYERIEGAAAHDALWDPNDLAKFVVSNGVGLMREKDITDGGFLELVRFGVRRALSYHVMESLPEYDGTIGVFMPGIGMGFRRYLGDRYNYDEATGKQTAGMPWPLLTGERAHYELAKAVELGLTPFEIDQTLNPYILAMERMATENGYLPEQIWDSGPRMGTPTGAATPLGWAHAEYLKLLRSRLDREVFDHRYLRPTPLQRQGQ